MTFVTVSCVVSFVTTVLSWTTWALTAVVSLPVPLSTFPVALPATVSVADAVFISVWTVGSDLTTWASFGLIA